MKKILLILTSFFIISCNSSDNDISSDKIIGTWNLYKVTKNGVDDPQSNCDKQSNFIYRKDNTYTETIISDGFNNSGCRTVEVRNGTWKNNNDGTYYKELDSGDASSNLDYVFEGNSTFYVSYTINNTAYKIYYKRS